MDKGEQEVKSFWVAESNEQLPVPSKLKRKVGPKKMEFVGWGSKPLIEFLESIGKLTDKQLSQYEVAAIINEHIRTNNLLHPQKKKRVVCDEWLHSLFGRKSVARNKIYDLLETHFAENHDNSEDELLYSSEENEENFMMSFKKQKTSSSEKKAPQKKKQEPETPKSCFAAIISENIKLMYLRRSLVQDLLKDPESFEVKVVGSYVRIKCDPNDYFQKNSHQLLQVTGVSGASGCDDIGTDILLHVPNLIKHIPICMLSDENFSEEECEDLRQRVKDGLLKRPTVVEFEQKVGILHKDITKHWLVRELALLQNLIDRANEKGWRRAFTLFDYMERKQLLQTPSEQSRLLREVPKVIAEELEPEVTLQDPAENVEQENNCSQRSIVREATDISIDLANQTLSTQNYGSTAAAGSTDAIIQSHVTFNSSVSREGNKDLINGITSVKEPDGIQAALGTYKPDKKMGSRDAVIQSHVTFNSPVSREGNKDLINGITSVKEPDGIQAALGTYKQDKKMEYQPAYLVQQQKQPFTVTSKEMRVVNSGERNGSRGMAEKKVAVSQVIELSDDDDDEAAGKNGGVGEQIVDHPESSIWYYLDPQGNIQGPFSMVALKRWSDLKYFHPSFKVWKTGQSQDKAVLLIDLIRRMCPY